MELYRGMTTEGDLVISGRVTDTRGSPFPGLLVFGFTDAGMSQRPLAVSQRTDADGRYWLRLNHPSQLHLMVRISRS